MGTIHLQKTSFFLFTEKPAYDIGINIIKNQRSERSVEINLSTESKDDTTLLIVNMIKRIISSLSLNIKFLLFLNKKLKINDKTNKPSIYRLPKPSHV